MCYLVVDSVSAMQFTGIGILHAQAATVKRITQRVLHMPSTVLMLSEPRFNLKSAQRDANTARWL